MSAIEDIKSVEFLFIECKDLSPNSYTEEYLEMVKMLWTFMCKFGLFLEWFICRRCQKLLNDLFIEMHTDLQTVAIPG